MSLDKQHVMGAAAEASEPALVASLPEPVPVSASGDGQAQGGPSRELIRACIQWAFDSVGDGFVVPEEAFWAYSRATGDEDWETLPDRLSDAGDTALEASSRQEGRLREVAWLVEFPESGDSYHGGKRVGPATPVQWYCGLPVRTDQVCARTANPNEAIRFARKCDAEAVILLLENESQWKGHGRIGAFASEHVWIAALEPPHAKEQGS